MKNKRVYPSKREKKRYVLYELISEDNAVSRTKYGVALIEALNAKLGVFRSAAAGLQHVKHYPAANLGILRVANKAVQETLAATVFIDTLNDISCTVKTLRTSGNLRGLKEHAETREEHLTTTPNS